jgi:Eph receptor B3
LPYVSREQANRLIIKLEYTIRECKKYPGDIRSCKETFQLLYIESDNQTLATNEFSESNYKYLKTIAAVNNLHASPSSSFASASLDQTMPDYAIYRTEVELPLRTDKKGVYLVFRDQGACVSLLSVKIAYTVCSAQVTNLIEFPETRTGSNATDLVQQSGKCVENAESIGTNTNLVPYAYCQTNGKQLKLSQKLFRFGFFNLKLIKAIGLSLMTMVCVCVELDIPIRIHSSNAFVSVHFDFDFSIMSSLK